MMRARYTWMERQRFMRIVDRFLSAMNFPYWREDYCAWIELVSLRPTSRSKKDYSKNGRQHILCRRDNRSRKGIRQRLHCCCQCLHLSPAKPTCGAETAYLASEGQCVMPVTLVATHTLYFSFFIYKQGNATVSVLKGIL